MEEEDSLTEPQHNLTDHALCVAPLFLCGKQLPVAFFHNNDTNFTHVYVSLRQLAVGAGVSFNTLSTHRKKLNFKRARDATFERYAAESFPVAAHYVTATDAIAVLRSTGYRDALNADDIYMLETDIDFQLHKFMAGIFSEDNSVDEDEPTMRVNGAQNETDTPPLWPKWVHYFNAVRAFWLLGSVSWPLPPVDERLELRRLPDGHPAKGSFDSLGLFVRRDRGAIPAGTVIGCYAAYMVPARLTPFNAYVMEDGEEGNMVFDAYAGGNETRFINDCKNLAVGGPNVCIDDESMPVDGAPSHVKVRVFRAFRDLQPGEECLIEYGKAYWDAMDANYKEAVKAVGADREKKIATRAIVREKPGRQMQPVAHLTKIALFFADKLLGLTARDLTRINALKHDIVNRVVDLIMGCGPPFLVKSHGEGHIRRNVYRILKRPNQAARSFTPIINYLRESTDGLSEEVLRLLPAHFKPAPPDMPLKKRPMKSDDDTEAVSLKKAKVRAAAEADARPGLWGLW